MSTTNMYTDINEDILRVYWRNILERPELVKSLGIGGNNGALLATMTDDTTVELPLNVLWENVLDKPELVKSVTLNGDKLVITNIDDTELEVSLKVLWANIAGKPKLIKKIVSGEDKLMVTFTDETTADIPVSTTRGLEVSQVTEIDVVAPKNVVIHIAETPDYALPPVEVLKQVPGETDKTEILCDFNAKDAEKFEPNPFVALDGTMYLKTQETFSSVQDESFTEGFLTVTTIDKTKLGEIVSIEVI